MHTHPSVGWLCYLCLHPHLKTHPRKPEKTQRLRGGGGREEEEEAEARESRMCKGRRGGMAGGKETRGGRGGGALRMGD